MDDFTKKRFTFWTIILLVVLNLFTLSMLWFTHKKFPPPMRKPQREQQTLRFLQKELNFTNEQIEKYNQLRKAHAEQAQVLIHDIRRLKKEMMDEIFHEIPDTLKAKQIAELIGEKQAKIERITFTHFLDLKQLCGTEQVGKLRRLIDEFFRKNPPPGQRKSPPPYRPDRPMKPLHDEFRE